VDRERVRNGLSVEQLQDCQPDEAARFGVLFFGMGLSMRAAST